MEVFHQSNSYPVAKYIMVSCGSGVYVLAISQYLFAIVYDYVFIDIIPENLQNTITDAPGGRTKFLTYWNIVRIFLLHKLVFFKK